MTSEEGEKKVIGVGLAVLDHLLLWQDAGRAVRNNKIADYQVQGGGMVATAMVAAARLGANAEYWGAVGDDWMGEMILDGLRAENVDTRHVVRVAGASGPTVIVCVDGATGERHFLYFNKLPEMPAGTSPPGAPEDLSSAGCVLIDGTYAESASTAAAEARRRGIPVVGDFGSPSERVRALLPHTDYAIVSEAFAARLAEDIHDACRMVRAMGPRCVVVTRGAAGLVCLADEAGTDPLEMPAFEVEVVDTTGAGDVFHGAFCAGLLRGWPLERNLLFASAVAAMKCRRLGGRAGIPRFDEVAGFLAERGEIRDGYQLGPRSGSAPLRTAKLATVPNFPIYPLRFKEVLRDYRFGDRWIVRHFAKTGLPEAPHPLGETWEVCDRSTVTSRSNRPGESSEILNGPLRGRTLRQAIDAFGADLLGSEIAARFGTRFPLLIKLLDATHTLGEQAHTNDELTAARGIDDYSGKTEAWYMLCTKPGAKVFCGNRPGVTGERLVEAVLAGEARTCMNEYPAEPGDAFLLYAGTMHYSPGGLLFYEIMQNSDVYVHLGSPREGSLEDRERQARQAVEAVHLEEGFDARTRPITLAVGPNRRTFVLACRHFCLERLDVSAAYGEPLGGRRFIVLTVIEGAARVTCGGALRERDARGTRGQDARDTEELHSGQSCLVPAAAGSVRIEPIGGAASVLKGYVPNLVVDVIEPLRAAGVRDEDIAALGGRTKLNPLPAAMSRLE